MFNKIKFLDEVEALTRDGYNSLIIVTKEKNRFIAYDMELEEEYVNINSINDGFDESIPYEDIISICSEEKDECVYKNS